MKNHKSVWLQNRLHKKLAKRKVLHNAPSITQQVNDIVSANIDGAKNTSQSKVLATVKP